MGKGLSGDRPSFFELARRTNSKGCALFYRKNGHRKIGNECSSLCDGTESARIFAEEKVLDRCTKVHDHPHPPSG